MGACHTEIIKPVNVPNTDIKETLKRIINVYYNDMKQPVTFYKGTSGAEIIKLIKECYLLHKDTKLEFCDDSGTPLVVNQHIPHSTNIFMKVKEEYKVLKPPKPYQHDHSHHHHHHTYSADDEDDEHHHHHHMKIKQNKRHSLTPKRNKQHIYSTDEEDDDYHHHQRRHAQITRHKQNKTHTMTPKYKQHTKNNNFIYSTDEEDSDHRHISRTMTMTMTTKGGGDSDLDQHKTLQKITRHIQRYDHILKSESDTDRGGQTRKHHRIAIPIIRLITRNMKTWDEATNYRGVIRGNTWTANDESHTHHCAALEGITQVGHIYKYCVRFEGMQGLIHSPDSFMEVYHHFGMMFKDEIVGLHCGTPRTTFLPQFCIGGDMKRKIGEFEIVIDLRDSSQVNDSNHKMGMYFILKPENRCIAWTSFFGKMPSKDSPLLFTFWTKNKCRATIQDIQLVTDKYGKQKVFMDDQIENKSAKKIQYWIMQISPKSTTKYSTRFN